MIKINAFDFYNIFNQKSDFIDDLCRSRAGVFDVNSTPLKGAL